MLSSFQCCILLLFLSPFLAAHSFDVQSGAGYSLSFQSANLGSDIATLWNYFDNSSYWPTTQIAFSFWLRCLSADIETTGIFCGSSIFIESYDANGYAHVYSPLVTMAPQSLSVLYQNVGNSLPGWMDFFNWHHYIFQTNTLTNMSELFIDGVLFGNFTYHFPPFNFSQAGTLVNIGRNFLVGADQYVEQAAGRGFFGQIDEISLWNRTFSPAEAASMYPNKLRGDENGLLCYWDLNEGTGTVARNLAFTGAAYDLHLGQTRNAHVYLDATTNTITTLTAPTWATSDIPIRVNQIGGVYSSSSLPLIVVPISNSSYFPLNFNISNYPMVSYIQILSGPTLGTLYQTPDGATAGSQINSFPTNVTYAGGVILYKVPAASTFFSVQSTNDCFQYLLVKNDGSPITNGTVCLIPNSAPRNTNQTLTAQSGLQLFASPFVINPRGGKVKWKILTVPLHGSLSQVNPDGTPSNTIAPGDFLIHSGGYFAYNPPLVGGGAGYDNFSYIAIDGEGVSSTLLTVSYNVNPFDYIPTTNNSVITVNENDYVIIELSSTDLDGQLVATLISSLPQHGSLYFVNDDGSLGAMIKNAANPYDGVNVTSSYATDVTGVSSFWGAGGNSYAPWQILGPQDVFKYGDSELTWCPLTLLGDGGLATGGTSRLNFSWNPSAAYTQYGYTEYIELVFSDPVYAVGVDVGMPRGMGSLVNVKAQSPLGWQSLWSQPASKQVLTTSASTKSYYTYQLSLCQTTYPVKSLRLEYDTRDIGDWAETDYVRFYGATGLRPGVFHWNNTRVAYKPHLNFFGNDSFQFVANDCPYSSLRTSAPGVISINVAKIDVPPMVMHVQAFATLGNDIQIDLGQFSVEVNGGQISKYTILSLPGYGKLISADGEVITSAPTNLTDGHITYTSNYWQWNGKENITFTFTAYAVLRSNEVATVQILLNVPGAENTALAWIVFLVLIFLTLPAFPLVITRANAFPLRTTSLSLNLFATFGVLLFANIPLQLISFTADYPCWLYYFCYMLSPAILCTPILVSLYRHKHVFHLTRLKRRIAKTGATSDDLENVAYLKKLTSEGRLLAITIAGCVIPLIISLALIPVASGTFGDVYCHMGSIVEYCFLIYWILYTAGISFGLYLVRNDHELTGFRRHIFYMALVSLFIGFLYLIVFGAIPEKSRFASFNLLFVIVALTYQFLAITRPAIQTFPFLRKPTKAKDDEAEPLSEVIITQKGFAWFLEFCMAEFSQESPLAWRSIQTFKTKTSYDAMRDIYTKFFADHAPLLVNLAASSIKDLRVACERITPQTPMQELQSVYDVVQMELLELMQQDSYMRFIASDYYQKYKRNEIVPRHEARSISNTHTGSSKGSKEHQEPFSKPGQSTITAQTSTPGDSRLRVDSLGASGTNESKIDPLSGGWAYEGDNADAKRSEISQPLTGALSSSVRAESPLESNGFQVELTALRESQPERERTETIQEGDDEHHDDEQEKLVFNFNPLGSKE